MWTVGSPDRKVISKTQHDASCCKVEKLQINPCLLWDLALALDSNGIALSRETLPELRGFTHLQSLIRVSLALHLTYI